VTGFTPDSDRAQASAAGTCGVNAPLIIVPCLVHRRGAPLPLTTAEPVRVMANVQPCPMGAAACITCWVALAVDGLGFGLDLQHAGLARTSSGPGDDRAGRLSSPGRDRQRPPADQASRAPPRDPATFILTR